MTLIEAFAHGADSVEVRRTVPSGDGSARWQAIVKRPNPPEMWGVGVDADPDKALAGALARFGELYGPLDDPDLDDLLA